MKKIKSYVDAMVADRKKVQSDLANDFFKYNFEDFLSLKTERNYKNEELLSFFTNIQLNLDSISKEEFTEYLTTIRKGYEKTRLVNNPINFSTNPMTNIVRLWKFEVYADLIKHIDIMLNKCN